MHCVSVQYVQKLFKTKRTTKRSSFTDVKTQINEYQCEVDGRRKRVREANSVDTRVGERGRKPRWGSYAKRQLHCKVVYDNRIYMFSQI